MRSFWFSKIVVLIFWDLFIFIFLRVGLVLFFSNLKKKKKCYLEMGFCRVGFEWSLRYLIFDCWVVEFLLIIYLYKCFM